MSAPARGLRGGRFNPAGEFEVLYAALAVDTAFAERDGLLLTAAGIKAAALVRTGVLLTLRCRLAAVLDLTGERVRARLGLSLGGVVGSWVAWSSAASPPAPSPDDRPERAREPPLRGDTVSLDEGCGGTLSRGLPGSAARDISGHGGGSRRGDPGRPGPRPRRVHIPTRASRRQPAPWYSPRGPAEMTKVATPRDHAHFAAIGAAEAAEEQERFVRAAETPPGERVLVGMRLGAALPLTPVLLAELDARADGQMELARRRIALGLGTKVSP